MVDEIEEYFSGRKLYGDDFSPEKISIWFSEEEKGYFDLATSHNSEYDYQYHSMNVRHGFSRLPNKTFDCCVALGCARGDELVPIAPKVSRFVAIEPAESWWSDRIAEKPTTFMKPTVSGDIDLPTASADLLTCLGVIHHIPNVSHVLSEMARIAKPGAYFLLREPIYSMGDWRKPRSGLTKNERGFPITWLRAKLAEVGFEIEYEAFCVFPALTRLIEKAGVRHPFKVPGVALADAVLSSVFGRGMAYHRRSMRQKIAPTSAFFVLRKI